MPIAEKTSSNKTAKLNEKCRKEEARWNSTENKRRTSRWGEEI